MIRLLRRRRRTSGAGGGGGSLGRRVLSTRLPSADTGLYFAATITYRWEALVQPEGDGAGTAVAPLLHPDAMARCLLKDAAASAVREIRLLDFADAENAVNARFSEGPVASAAGPGETPEEVRVGAGTPLELIAEARISASAEAVAEAEARASAAHRLRVRESVETTRLEILRERLLSDGLGLTWWLDLHADHWMTSDDPERAVASAVKAIDILTTALRHDSVSGDPDRWSPIRARVDTLLASLEDPDSRVLAARALDKLLRHIGRSVELDESRAPSPDS